MIFKILLAIVVLSPLPFASVYPWSTSLIAVCVGLLLLAWMAEQVLKREAFKIGLHSIWPLAAFFAFSVFWIIFQAVVSPPQSWAAPVWRQATDVLGTPLRGAISINPESTLTALMNLLTYAGIFWLAFQYGRTIEKADMAIRTIVLAVFCYSLYGLWIAYTGSQTILWFSKFAYYDDLTSTFVNRNSFATYAGIGLVCTTAIFIRRLSGPLAKPFSRSERLRQIIDDVLEHSWFYLVVWVVIMMALLLSHSRAGFLSTALSLVLLTLVLSTTKGVRLKYALIMCGLSLGVISILLFFGGDALDNRFALLFSNRIPRLEVYQSVIGYIETHPWAGTGYGTFPEAFHVLRTPDIEGLFLKAHNTYLEVIMEIGLPAAISLFTLHGYILYLTFQGIRTRRQGIIFPSIGFSMMVLVILHSLIDFSLQIPAVAITYSFIIGVACAQSWSLSRPSDKW